ncbi:hypothetical protein KWF73_18380 [Acinetobacter pittii]|uniref:hypothetical protein n=1 Tax=Acinetobacter pittii TaxID=48296 RepID=UPI00355AF344
MTNFNTQRGNAFLSALGAAVMITMIIFVGWLLLQPYQVIDEGRNNELQAMVNSVKGTSFESPFKAKINYYLEDGKISNNEFSKLNELYSGFKSSKLTGDEQNFSVKTKQDLEAQYKSDEQAKVLYGYLYYLLFGLGVVVVGVMGWKKAHGYM